MKNYRRLFLEPYGTHKYSSNVWTKCRVF